MLKMSDVIAGQTRKKFRKVASLATGSLIGGRDGMFCVHGATYISVVHWRGKVEVEVVIGNTLWRKFKRSARHPRVTDGEKDAFREFQERGPAVLLEGLRRSMSEALHAGVSREAIVRMAGRARRRRSDTASWGR